MRPGWGWGAWVRPVHPSLSAEASEAYRLELLWLAAGMTSGLYTEKGVVVDETESEQVLTRALELGCNFLDSSDAYGPHLNETFLGTL